MAKSTMAAFRLKSKLNLQTLTGIILGATILMGGAYFLHPFTTENTNAANTDISVNYNGEEWNIAPPTSTAADANGLKFEIEGNPAGVNVAKKDTVTGGGTNVPNYQIYVSVNSEGGKIPATSGDSAIAATSGTSTAPAALGSNSWGYALSSFNSGINYDDLVSSSKSDSWSNSKWAKLPYVATDNLSNSETVEGTAAKIYDSTTDTGDSVDVYYAVNADNDLASGEYQTTVTYTLIGEMPTTTLKDAAESAGITTMQGMEGSSVCDNASVWQEGDDDLTLKDSRDSNTYTIRKLADGHCWMVANLRLGKTSAMTLSSSDTDITDNTWILPASTGGDGSSWAESYDVAYIHIGTVSDSNWSLIYGNYYNWTAATAGQGTNSTTSGNINVSICPKGWKLPKGEANTVDYSWAKLYNAYSSNASNFQTATNTGSSYLSGDYYNGSLDNAGTSGSWWSRTAGNNYYAYSLRAASDNAYPQYYYNPKYYGFSVRCVFASS